MRCVLCVMYLVPSNMVRFGFRIAALVLGMMMIIASFVEVRPWRCGDVVVVFVVFDVSHDSCGYGAIGHGDHRIVS